MVLGMATNEALAAKVKEVYKSVRHCMGALQDIKVLLAAMNSKCNRVLSLLSNKAKNEDSHDNIANQQQKGFFKLALQDWVSPTAIVMRILGLTINAKINNCLF